MQWGDSVFVMSRCTHPDFANCEIASIYAAPRTMICVSPASLLGMSDMIISCVHSPASMWGWLSGRRKGDRERAQSVCGAELKLT
jgi:hypothetical protein